MSILTVKSSSSCGCTLFRHIILLRYEAGFQLVEGGYARTVFVCSKMLVTQTVLLLLLWSTSLWGIFPLFPSKKEDIYIGKTILPIDADAAVLIVDDSIEQPICYFYSRTVSVLEYWMDTMHRAHYNTVMLNGYCDHLIMLFFLTTFYKENIQLCN